ncbi:MAG: SpoIIE family protein phosphatase [Kiritimatiellae bacterium]|nr:SpoIIE family protein phosphatase [Kiritimatiellia bacterium]
MFRNLRIAARMALLIIAGAGVILGAIIGYSYITARRLLEEELQDKACFLAAATAGRIEPIQRAVEKVVEGLATQLERSPASTEEMYELIETAVARNKEVYGSAIALRLDEDGRRPPAPYVCRSREPGGGPLRMDLAEGGYAYEVWDWFTMPRDMARPVWTEPYFDEGAGNILMVTYSVPFRAPGGANAFLGVVTGDVSLEWLTDLLAALPLGQSGYAFLISGNGTYISHPMREMIMNETLFSAAQRVNQPAMREVGRRMVRGETGFTHCVGLLTHKDAWLAYAPVPAAGWSIGLMFPKEELLAKVLSLSHVLTAVGLAGFAMLLAVALVIARSITAPLRQLEAATRTLSTGNLDAILPVIPGDDEVAHLSASFDTMRADLKHHIEELQRTTAAKERIESEIHIARTIQMSLIPRSFPPFPQRHDLDLYAMLEPAREVGGDFYDFFMNEENRLCLVIGDVSGKGIPAALYMAVARTFIRWIWREEPDPAAMLTRLNAELARENEENMFVTLFCARVNLSTGECDYANGGHNPPFILHADGRVELVRKVKGAVVGGIEEMTFEEGRLALAPGDTLFMYTDGVTEAMDPAGKLSGEEWAIRRLEAASRETCKSVLSDMLAAVRAYAADAEQADDITMMAFRYLRS